MKLSKTLSKLNNYLIKISQNEKLWQTLAIGILIIFALGSSLISIHRFWQYNGQYYDLGIFDTALWQASQLQAPIIDHYTEAAGKWIFADHFSPAIFLLTPLYWLYPGTEIILVAQAVIVALSGGMLFLIAQKLIKNPFVSFAVMTTYFLYAGLQHALWFDFHEVTVLTLAMTGLFYFFVTKNHFWHMVFFIFCLLFKETLFIFGIGWAVFIFFYRKEWRKTALVISLISVAWYFLTTQLIIPAFRGEKYFYQVNMDKILSLKDLIIYTLTPFDKIKFFLLSALSFGLTIFLVPELFGVVGLHYLIRFLSDASTRYTLGFHYNAEIAPIFAFGMILAILRIKNKYVKNKLKSFYIYLTAGILCLALIFYQFITLGPFRLAYIADFYKSTPNFVYLDKLRNQIPQDATVMAQNNLASRLTHQKQLWLLRENYEDYRPEYIFLDARDGQNVNNYYGIRDIADLQLKINKDFKYVLVDREDKAFLYKRVMN